MGIKDWIETPSEIDYGPIERSFSQTVIKPGVCESGYQREDYDLINDWWFNLIGDPNLTDNEILKEAWGGKGNLWVYTRPDR